MTHVSKCGSVRAVRIAIMEAMAAGLRLVLTWTDGPAGLVPSTLHFGSNLAT
jgi:hypothetical protein